MSLSKDMDANSRLVAWCHDILLNPEELNHMNNSHPLSFPNMGLGR